MTSDQQMASTREVAARLGEGRDAYSSGDAERSRIAFMRVVQLDPACGEAWYHLGLLAYAAQEFDAAERALARAVALGHRVDVASQYLELVCRAAGRSTPARPPASTQVGQREVDVARQAVDAQSSADDVDPVNPFGVYEVLATSDDPLIRQPLPIMQALQLRVRPRPQAYVHRFVYEAICGLLLGYVCVQITQSVRFLDHMTEHRLATTTTVVLVGTGLVVVIWTWQAVDVATTLFVLEKGRLQRVRGVFTRTVSSWELYRVSNISLHRNVFQRVTRDGRLELLTTHDHIHVIGLARGQDLDRLHQGLLDLVFALRANNYVRGIIN